jgi:hypothetical protein
MDERLNKALKLSYLMLDHAKKGDWEGIEQVDQQRKKILQQFFSSNDGSQSDEVAECVQKMLDLNEQLVQVCELKKTGFGQNLRQINRGKKAKKAYSA